jgi:S1-C subfamily serine protease
MLRKTKILIAVMSIASLPGLSGCGLDLATRAAIEVGGHLVLAGIDAATSNSGTSEDVEGYCWDPEKQSASTSMSPSCWSPQVKITEDEYDKFKDTGVAPAVAQSQVAATGAASKEIHCVDPSSQHYYILRYVEHCPPGDVMLPEAEWQKRKTLQLEGSQVATAPAHVYCWDSEKALEYQLADGQNCGGDHRITEEQFLAQRARREEAKKAEAAAEQVAKATDPVPAVAERLATPPVVKQDEPAPSPEPVQQVQQAAIEPQEISLDLYDIVSAGTAFAVSRDGALMTAAHVVSKCDATAALSGAGIYEAKVLDANARFDLAVLRLPFSVETFASFAAAMPEQGDDVFVIGYPLLSDFRAIKITNGIVSGLSGLDRDSSRIQMTAAVQPGNSGGPLVNGSGLVVGVVVSKLSGEVQAGVYAEGINFAVTHEAAAAFLSINGVTVKRSASTKELKGREIMRRTEAWTVPLLCLTKKSAS